MNISRKAVAWTLGVTLLLGGGAAVTAVGASASIDPSASAVPALVQDSAKTVAVQTQQETVAVVAAQVAAKAAADAAAAQAIADAQAAAQAAAAQAAAQAAQKAASAPVKSGAPRGTALPFYPSSDPQNANHGDYADPGSFCASGSASTVNGVPTCD